MNLWQFATGKITKISKRVSVAQLVECKTSNSVIEGSNPAEGGFFYFFQPFIYSYALAKFIVLVLSNDLEEKRNLPKV